MKQPTWRDTAIPVIQRALADADAQGITDPKERWNFVNARYPFGPRAYHPYRIWMSAMRELVQGKTPAKRRAAKERKALTADGQRDMFGEVQP